MTAFAILAMFLTNISLLVVGVYLLLGFYWLFYCCLVVFVDANTLSSFPGFFQLFVGSFLCVFTQRILLVVFLLFGENGVDACNIK